jgi:hypothetical protein
MLNGLFFGIRDTIPLIQAYQIMSLIRLQKYVIVFTNSCTKQTRARDKLRYVPLEAASVKLLLPLAGEGRVIPLARRIFQSLRRELCKEMRVRWPENCLRNSYATYAQTFRSSGEVARAMGDSEITDHNPY